MFSWREVPLWLKVRVLINPQLRPNLQDWGVTSELSWRCKLHARPRVRWKNVPLDANPPKHSDRFDRPLLPSPPTDVNDNRRSAQVKQHLTSQSALLCNSSRQVDFKVGASLQPDRFPAHMHARRRHGCLGGTVDNGALIAPTGSACPSQCHISG